MPVQPLPSVTLMMIGKEPICVGVPESVPFVPSVRPEGSVLVVVNVAPPIAPACVNVWLNAWPAVPAATAGFVTAIVWHAMTSVYVVAVPVQPFESVTVTTIGNEPVCVGVPESAPFEASVRPVGRVLAVENVAEPTAPVCVKVWLKAWPAVPAAIAGFVTMIVGQLMTSVYVAPVPVQPLASVTVTTIGKEPVCVGVPDSVPFAASVRPAGRVLAVENVAEPTAPVCVKVWLKGVPATPVVVPGFVTVIV